MKRRILNSLIASILIFSSLLLISCEEEIEHPYGKEIRDDEEFAYGCHYYVPEGFSKTKVTYSEFAYTDKVAELTVDPLNPEQMEEYGIDTGITVYAYHRQFMALNGIPLDRGVYDEATDTAYVEYTSDFGGSEAGLSAKYCKWKIMRNEYYLYIVTASCPPELVDKYKSTFDEWLSYAWVEAITDAPPVTNQPITDQNGNPIVDGNGNVIAP